VWDAPAAASASVTAREPREPPFEPGEAEQHLEPGVGGHQHDRARESALKAHERP